WRIGHSIGRVLRFLGVIGWPERAAMRKEVATVRASGLFDESYYRRTYPDLANVQIDLVRHYCEHGWREGRNPSASFDTRYYLDQYADIRNAGMNPFYHFVTAGKAELRRAVPSGTSYPPAEPSPSPAGADPPGRLQASPMSEVVARDARVIHE